MKILIIGMGPGIGLALARRFGAARFEVLMLARDAEKLHSIEAELAAAGIATRSYAADIADAEAYSKCLTQIAAEHPDLDILHYNASAFNPALPSELAPEVLEKDFSINTMGALRAVQAFLPAMKNREKGSIFMTGGGSALKAPPELVALSIGKAGMRNLALCLAQELAPTDIQVATVTICGMVAPGTRFDPERIAGEFWRLYQLPKEQWEREVVMQ